MSKRKKEHAPGDRLSIYLNKDLPDHFFEWLHKQDDISALVLFALENLYKETGNKNLSNLIPRRFHFDLDQPALIQKSLATNQAAAIGKGEVESPNIVEVISEQSVEETDTSFKQEVPPTIQENRENESAPLESESTFENKKVVQNQASDYVPLARSEDPIPVVESVQEEQKPSSGWANLGNISVDDF